MLNIIGRKGCYRWKTKSVLNGRQRAEIVKEKIALIYFDLKQRYGSPKIILGLAFWGYKTSRIIITIYMNQLGLWSKIS